MAALLTSVKDNKDKTAVYLAECRAIGIEVLVPDVNRSAAEFTPAPPRRRRRPRGGLRAGRRAQRGGGAGGADRGRARRAGPFADVYDFCRRVDPLVLNKRTMESLVKAGAFDSLGHPRQGLCVVLEEIVDRTLERRREHEVGIATLFSSLEPADGDDDAGRWEGTRVPDARPRVRQGPTAGLREGDARPLRERPPPHGARAGALSPHRLPPLRAARARGRRVRPRGGGGLGARRWAGW